MALRLQVAMMLTAVAVHGAVLNPTGACGVKSSRGAGGRWNYHSPGEVDTYVPDCQNPLRREYWRVFVQRDRGTAYVIPRPDDMGTKFGLCEDGDPDALFRKYGLCSGTDFSVSAVNNMETAEALNITHALHGRLVFQATQSGDGWGIDPFAPEDDILAVCDEAITDDADALAHCKRLRARCSDGACQGIAIVPNEASARSLVPALNELYGTSASRSGLQVGIGPTSASRSGLRVGIGAIVLCMAALL